MKNKLKYMMAGFSLLSVMSTKAGTFVASGTDSYNTSDLHKIVLDGDTVMAVRKDGVSVVYKFSSLQRILFTESSEVAQISAENGDELYLYPNPVDEELHLEGAPINVSVILMDIRGRRLRQTITDGDRLLLNVSNLSSGVYLVKVGDKVVRFIKK
jgi:hypothetical protein